MITKFRNKQSKIAVIGLGYVGLPIALAFAKHFKVIGFDISQPRIDLMRNGVDPSKELDAEEFQNRDIFFTDNPTQSQIQAFQSNHEVLCQVSLDKYHSSQ